MRDFTKTEFEAELKKHGLTCNGKHVSKEGCKGQMGVSLRKQDLTIYHRITLKRAIKFFKKH